MFSKIKTLFQVSVDKKDTIKDNIKVVTNSPIAPATVAIVALVAIVAMFGMFFGK